MRSMCLNVAPHLSGALNGMPLRVVFFGTGTFAEPVFRAIGESSHQLTGLVTQPDRTGEGHHRHINPLKAWAEERGVPVLQPVSIKSSEALADFAQLPCDLAVVAAYGQLLPRAVLETPRLGCINVHASLLPKYRGATPIHAAIRHGETQTGVSIIHLEPALDAGPVLGQASLEIGPQETTGELECRLAQLAVPLTIRVIDELEAGRAIPLPQDESLVTRAGKLTKLDGAIDWTLPAEAIDWHIRAMQPWPGPFTFLHRTGRPAQRLKILEVQVQPGTTKTDSTSRPGAVLTASADGILVATGEGLVRLVRLQPDGKRALFATEAVNGRLLQVGDRLSSSEQLAT